MKLRFAINQPGCLIEGIGAPKSIATVEVNPAKLSKGDCRLIADRLSGINVCRIEVHADLNGVSRLGWGHTMSGDSKFIRCKGQDLIVAEMPDFDSLMRAIRDNEAEVEKVVKSTHGK